jgi:hypothetical protein
MTRAQTSAKPEGFVGEGERPPAGMTGLLGAVVPGVEGHIVMQVGIFFASRLESSRLSNLPHP